MPVDLGLFDIMQADPLDERDTAAIYRQKLDDLEAADELGFQHYFTAERHFMREYRCSSGTAWIGAASQRTKNMRIGVMAYTLPIHNPVSLAEDVAVLDWMSDGRLEVGIGLGHRTAELEVHGVNPANRLRVFQERIAILEGLWSGGQVTIDSEYNTIKGAAINPLPLQEPRPPLWYAGNNPPAAQWAGTSGMSLAIGFRKTVDLIDTANTFRTGVQNRKSQEIEIDMPGEGRLAIMRQIYVSESDETAFAEVADDLYRLQVAEDATEANRPDRRERAESAARDLMGDEMVIAGSPNTAAAAIHDIEEQLGIDLFLANVYAGGVDPERSRRTMELLATETREALKKL